MMRLCPKCQQVKPLTDFYHRSTGAPCGYCKPCHNRATQRSADRRPMDKEKAYQQWLKRRPAWMND